ncbi:hypothetical protein DOTSEDRAFT_72761 [Dothistroma septosporum NZE10]|uniref:Uncharacterized protein n=1 Tax=Dothistroma septosporum (strain NZE10 / CBS 128990) TaxID=675120 RepID=M2YND2_DOTSN|nr:hypothetical protein DOTSEDRAFT_72761 [Dothistroma septosporum NZE10]
MATSTQIAPTMSDMSKLGLSLDLTSDADLTPASETTTLKSETSTLNEQNMSVASSRSSICSFSTDNSNILSPLSSTKTAKKVRFEESVSWSYFDDPASETRPEPDRRASFLGRSWQRFKQRNTSGDLDITPPAIQLQQLKRQNSSMDILSSSQKGAKSSLLASSAARRSSMAYSERHPLREGTGRRFNGAKTHVTWRAREVTAKGDWGDLLSNPRQSALYA